MLPTVHVISIALSPWKQRALDQLEFPPRKTQFLRGHAPEPLSAIISALIETLQHQERKLKILQQFLYKMTSQWL